MLFEYYIFVIKIILSEIQYSNYQVPDICPNLSTEIVSLILGFSYNTPLSFIHPSKPNSVCFRSLLTWIGEMSSVEKWKRFMNNCVQPTASSVQCRMPQASLDLPVSTRRRGVLSLREIWRKVCLLLCTNIVLDTRFSPRERNNRQRNVRYNERCDTKRRGG